MLLSCGPNLEQQLTGSKWQIESMISDKAHDFNYDGQENTDLYRENPYCRRDDIYILNPGKEFLLDEYDDVCFHPKIRTGKWGVKEKQLTLDFQMRPTVWMAIDSYSEDEMIATYTHYDSGIYKVKVTFKKVP